MYCTYQNTAVNPTLTVRVGTSSSYSTISSSIAIYTNGVRYAYWSAGQTIILTYSGSYWYVASTPVYASTATIGNPAGQRIYLDGVNQTFYNASGQQRLKILGDGGMEVGNMSYNNLVLSNSSLTLNYGDKKFGHFREEYTYTTRENCIKTGAFFISHYDYKVPTIQQEEILDD